MPINDPDDLFEDPHLKATGYWQEVEDPELGTLRLPGFAPEFSRTPLSLRSIARWRGPSSSPMAMARTRIVLDCTPTFPARPMMSGR